MTQTSGVVGADTARLHQLANDITTAAQSLNRIESRLNVLLGRTKWNGPDRGAFLIRWTRELGPTMKSASDALHESSRVLHRNADDQEWASSSSGGATAALLHTIDSGVDLLAGAMHPVAPDLPGDLGGTFDWETRGSWDAPSGEGQEAGRGLLAQTLQDTADQSKIAPDEFEIIALDNGKYIVVLPGVTDLSKWPEWAKDNAYPLFTHQPTSDSPMGLDPLHRSVRDLDYGAFGSASGPSFDHNPYAQYVDQAMKAYGVPPGSDITIIGHSYGADTAVDLAASPVFNGDPTGYNVTHVLAAGYHSEPALVAVPDRTQVVAIQNSHDIVAAVERGGHGPIHVIGGMNEIVDGTRSGDGSRVLGGVAATADATAQTLNDVATAQLDFAAEVVRGARPMNPFGGVDDAWNDLVTLDPRTSVTQNGQVNIVFDGGDVGHGHHPTNYIGYVTNTDSAELAAFERSLAESGYTGSGVATAHDVSVPQ